MRKALTPPESRLWVAALRSLRPEGIHFRRQVPFRGYYLDFVRHAHRMVVEVDGATHDFADRQAHDATRDAVLEREGYHTLRFAAVDIRDNLEGVLQAIRLALASYPTRRSAPPSP